MWSDKLQSGACFVSKQLHTEQKLQGRYEMFNPKTYNYKNKTHLWSWLNVIYTLYFAFSAVCWKQHEEPFNCLNSPNLVILRLALRQCLSACLSFHVLICEMLHWSLSLFPPCAIPTFFRISVDVHVSIITKFYTTLSFSLRLMTLNIIWQFQQLKKVSWGSGIGPFLYYF